MRTACIELGDQPLPSCGPVLFNLFFQVVGNNTDLVSCLESAAQHYAEVELSWQARDPWVPLFVKHTKGPCYCLSEVWWITPVYLPCQLKVETCLYHVASAKKVHAPLSTLTFKHCTQHSTGLDSCLQDHWESPDNPLSRACFYHENSCNFPEMMSRGEAWIVPQRGARSVSVSLVIF